MYLYENHMGGIYTSEEIIDYNDLYCEECGDSDRFIGKVEEDDSIEQVFDLVNDYCGIDLCEWADHNVDGECHGDCSNCALYNYSGGYCKEAIMDLFKEMFLEEEINDFFKKLVREKFKECARTEKEASMEKQEMLEYLKSTGLYESKLDLYYVERMISENKTVPIRELVERFIEIDKEYKGQPWNILQILNNIDIIVPVEDRKA